VNLFSELATLIFQKRCLLCSTVNHQLDSNLGICVICLGASNNKRSIVNRGLLRIFVGSEFNSTNSHIILAAKEDNNKFARRVLADYLNSALELATCERTVFLIPIPSRKAADRIRGFAHVSRLIQELAKLNPDRKFELINCLRHTKKIRDQSTLNINERELNMRGAFEIDIEEYNRLTGGNISKFPLFLVDDLVTTGSTVLAANSALISLGIAVKGVLASCATNGFTH
jgi:predicted amidophosphoribosyltransferase